MIYCFLFLIKKGSSLPSSSVIKSLAAFSILVVVVIYVSWKFSPVLLILSKGVTAVTHSRKSTIICFLNLTKQSPCTNQRLLQMSYFVALKKVPDNTAFVVLSVLPATMVNKIRVHVLFLGILEITDHLGHQCGLSVKRTLTCCLAKAP